MKQLDVPLILQEPGSDDCGPTCVRMVLQYYGIKRSLEELKPKLEYFPEGTTAYANGSLLLGEGLSVTAITAHPMLFPPDVAATIRTTEDLHRIINAKKESHPKYKEVLDTFSSFLDEGGKRTIAIPSFNHIKEAIDADSPLIALIYGQAMGSSEGDFHFVVVSGYDEGKVHITNPAPKSVHQGWFPVDQFLYALHTSTTYDIDNGTLLVISK